MSRAGPSPQAQQPPGTYMWNQLDGLLSESRRAGLDNLTAAADYVTQMFQANGIPHALMGGFSLKLRGNLRNTYDVDVAVGCNMQQLIEVLSGQNRVIRPLNPVSGVMRIFILTGGVHNPGLEEVRTEVDLILGGALSTPDNPETASEYLSVSTGLGPRQYHFLILPVMIRIKLRAFFSRRSDNDYEDIVWLMQHHAEVVIAARLELSENYRREFAREYSRRNRGQANFLKVMRVKQVLGFEE